MSNRKQHRSKNEGRNQEVFHPPNFNQPAADFESTSVRAGAVQAAASTQASSSQNSSDNRS